MIKLSFPMDRKQMVSSSKEPKWEKNHSTKVYVSKTTNFVFWSLQILFNLARKRAKPAFDEPLTTSLPILHLDKDNHQYWLQEGVLIHTVIC